MLDTYHANIRAFRNKSIINVEQKFNTDRTLVIHRYLTFSRYEYCSFSLLVTSNLYN